MNRTKTLALLVVVVSAGYIILSVALPILSAFLDFIPTL